MLTSFVSFIHRFTKRPSDLEGVLWILRVGNCYIEFRDAFYEGSGLKLRGFGIFQHLGRLHGKLPTI